MPADLARKLLFSAVTTVAALLILEGLSWLGGRVELPDPLVTEKKPEWRDLRMADPLLFWRLRPDFRDGDTLAINSLGLRGPEVGAKEPGELRILSLGESTTYGSQVRYEETYSAQLEQQLGRCAGAGRRVRVINAGVMGYSLFQGVTYLEHRGLDLEPDAVLLYFGYNDFLPVSYRARRDAADLGDGAKLTDRELFDRRRRWPARISTALAATSNLYRRLLLLVASSPPSDSLKADRTRVRVPAADRMALLDRARELCARRGVRLLVVIPWYRRFDRHEELLRSFAERTGTPTADLPRLLADPSIRRREFFLDRVHPTPAGHRLMAEAIAEVLVQDWGPSWGLDCP